MEETTPSWRLLTSSLKVTGSPTLLIKHDLPQNKGVVSRMKVCLTDLTYLWTETTERRDIGRLAYAYDSPIDPSLQMDLLLKYLDKGLNSGPETSLTLRSEKGRSHLVLHLRCKLDQPKEEKTPPRYLNWDFNLGQASEMDFTKEFVLPLVGNLFQYQSGILNLKNIIADKDKALQRIDTELKTHNKEITGLFDKRFFGEHAPEKHKRSILMNKLPGFKPFDDDKWQYGMGEHNLPKHRDLNKHVFEQGLTAKVSPDSLSEAAWWEDLGHAIEVEEPSQISQPVLLQRASTSAFESSQTQHPTTRAADDRQTGHRNSSPTEARSKKTIDDEEDSDATASTISDLESSAPDPPARGIGKIGGRRSSDERNDRTNMAQSSDADVRPESRSIDIEANEGRPRGGIGKIGGLRRPQGVIDDSAANLSESGNIPARPITKNGEDSTNQADKGSAVAKEVRASSPDRRRELKKHDLEEKAKAPIKKKRKF